MISTVGKAGSCADSFFAAVQGGRVAEARLQATADMGQSLDILEHPRAPVTDRERMLLRLRDSKRVEEIGGYGGNFSVLCGHVALDGDTGTFIVSTSAFVLLRHEEGGWRVAEVGSGIGPPICESEAH